MAAERGDRAEELDLQLPGNRIVPARQLGWRATTSGGPGGQHANRTASRVEVIVRIADLPLRPEEVARLYERLASRIVGVGELVVACAETRDQHRNRRIAVRRLERVIADALHVDRRRVPTRMSHGARMRARDAKQSRSQAKRSRTWRWDGSE